MSLTPRESMVSLCEYFAKHHHSNQMPPDLSVLSVAECGEEAPVENGKYSNYRSYDISDPDFLHEPSPNFEKCECKCNDCYINWWALHDMNLEEKELQSDERQLWIFFGNFWKYDPSASKIPANVVMIWKNITSARQFDLKLSWKGGYLPHQEEECYTSWDHQQVSDILHTESNRLGIDPSDLQIYIGRMFEKWD